MSSVLKSPLQPTSRKPTECSNSSCTTCNKPSYLNANASAPRILARCGTREPDSPITKAEIPSHKNYVALGFSLSIRAKLGLLSLRDLRPLAFLSGNPSVTRSEEHTSELQSPCNLVCRL